MPSSVRWLGALVLLAVGTALAAGATLWLQTRSDTRTQAEAMTGGSVDAGHAAIVRYGCGACHDIPGVAGATGRTGPALAGIANRAQIAGVLVNDPRHMRAWLRSPQTVLRGNGMPDQGVTPKDAVDMAAYLYTLKN